MKKVIFHENCRQFDYTDFKKLAERVGAEQLTPSVYYVPSQNVTMVHHTDGGYWNSEVVLYGKSKGIETIERIFEKTRKQIKFDKK